MVEALPERIERKIEYEPNSNCWIWVGARSHGYGILARWRKPHYKFAHRVVYELLRGPIPADKELDHRCRLPACVNPDHLEPVTHRENILRGAAVSARNARKTHCPRGHPYDFFETGRRCRECRRAVTRVASLRYYYRHLAPRS